MHRFSGQLVTAVALTLALAAPAVAATAAPQTDKLVILSTTDMKGKTSPCGCHVPKGGLARQVGFADSIRTLYANVVRVDDGGYFPEEVERGEAAWFLMDELKKMNVVAVG